MVELRLISFERSVIVKMDDPARSRTVLVMTANLGSLFDEVNHFDCTKHDLCLITSKQRGLHSYF